MGKSKKNKNEKPKAEPLGKKFKYFVLLGATVTCANCGREHKSGMLTEYDGKRFCNEQCLKDYLGIST